MPTCLLEAYQRVGEDRAWVACLVKENGVVTLASQEKLVDVLRSPGACFALPTCPQESRVPFLLGGVIRLSGGIPA